MPQEWAKLESAVGHWQGSFDEQIDYAPAVLQHSSRANPFRRKVRFFFNNDIGGVKFLYLGIFDDGTESVRCSNRQYHFRLNKTGPRKRHYITEFVSVKDIERSNEMIWSRDISVTNYVLIAETLEVAKLAT